MLDGIFLLLITFTDEPRREFWNHVGPLAFSSYQDCVQAAELAATFIAERYTITCSSQKTGEVHATWSLGKEGGG